MGRNPLQVEGTPALPDNAQPSWSRRVAFTLLVLGTPLFLLVAYMGIVQFPLDTIRGVRGVFSGHDAVQLPGSMETGVTLALLIAAAWALLRLVHIDLFGWVSFAVLLYGGLLIIPLIFTAGFAVRYGLETTLEARGYTDCAFHVTSTDRGESGFTVYVRIDRPTACQQVQAMFPKHHIVDGTNTAFDLPRP